MSWAAAAIEALRAGMSAVIQPHGRSMEPRVKSGARVTLEPVQVTDLQVDDIVLCRVSGNVYLHLVKAIEGAGADRRVLIGNNRGGTNGWTKAVYGRAITVENP